MYTEWKRVYDAVKSRFVHDICASKEGLMVVVGDKKELLLFEEMEPVTIGCIMRYYDRPENKYTVHCTDEMLEALRSFARVELDEYMERVMSKIKENDFNYYSVHLKYAKKRIKDSHVGGRISLFGHVDIFLSRRQVSVLGLPKTQTHHQREEHPMETLRRRKIPCKMELGQCLACRLILTALYSGDYAYIA